MYNSKRLENGILWNKFINPYKSFDKLLVAAFYHKFLRFSL